MVLGREKSLVLFCGEGEGERGQGYKGGTGMINNLMTMKKGMRKKRERERERKKEEDVCVDCSLLPSLLFGRQSTINPCSVAT